MLLLADVHSYDDDDDDDDFIEVAAKDGFEPTIPEHQREEYGLATTSTMTSAVKSWQEKDHQFDIEDPTSLVASMLKCQQLEQQKMMARLRNCLVCYFHC